MATLAVEIKRAQAAGDKKVAGFSGSVRSLENLNLEVGDAWTFPASYDVYEQKRTLFSTSSLRLTAMQRSSILRLSLRVVQCITKMVLQQTSVFTQVELQLNCSVLQVALRKL